MRVGVQMVFQSYGYGPDVSDGQVVGEEVRLGVLADDLGFDALWPVEHRFEDYAFVQAWGTPEQVLERLQARREVIGDFDLTACFRFAGLPIGDAERSMRTFAREVLPALHAS